MFKHKKAFLMILVTCIICGVVAITAFYTKNDTNTENDTILVDAYFLNPNTNKLEVEKVEIGKGENTVVATELLNKLYEGPVNKNLKKIATDDLKYLEGNRLIDNSILELQMPLSYNDLSIYDEVFFRSSIVWTMTSLDFVKYIRIYVGEEQLKNPTGELVGDLSRDNVLLDPTITPEKMVQQTVNLYFSKENGLVEESRKITYNQDSLIEKSIVEELIKGTKSKEYKSDIPADTKIKNIRTEDGVCYVNISKDFINKMEKGKELQAVYSIVNSLTKLDESDIKSVKKVQFLIESEIIVGFTDIVDLSKQLEQNDDIIITYE